MMAANADRSSPATFWKAKAESKDGPVWMQQRGRESTEFLRLFRFRLTHVFAVSIAISSSDLLSTYSLTEGLNLGFWLLSIIGSRILAVFSAVAVFSAAQVWISSQRLRMIVMTLAVLSICTATAALHASEWYTGLTKFHGETWGVTGSALFLYLFWMNTLVVSLLAIVYERQMRADQVKMTVRSTQLADEAIERQSLELRLNSVKARIDPEFLFAVIGRCEFLYGRDIDAAESLLNDFIEFLRTTVPQSNEAPSTLNKEMALCGVYLMIEKQLRKGVLRVQTTGDVAATSGQFPSFVLLLLVQSLLPPREASHSFDLSMTAERQAFCNCVELRCTGAAPQPQAQTIAAAAVALRSFFGPFAKVSLPPSLAGGNTILIEVPDERA